ncbi:MAG: hypothetical protein AAGK38_06805 [Pseudomonadota bacterium]
MRIAVLVMMAALTLSACTSTKKEEAKPEDTSLEGVLRPAEPASTDLAPANPATPAPKPAS